MGDDVVLLDSITDADPSVAGRIAVSGSHGGVFAAAVASRAGLRAVVLNDAGRGLRDAGVAGVARLADFGMAACAVDCRTAEIGSASDMAANGVISFVNSVASGAGVAVGQSVAEAVERLAHALLPTATMPAVPEARWSVDLVPGRPRVLCVDSASLIKPEDAGAVIVTGSHGGLIGGNPARACKAEARFVSFSDAGGGRNGIGFTRLPALAARGIAAATLDCDTCAIGSAESALADGVISAVNAPATAAGLRRGMRLEEALRHLLSD